MQPQGFETDFWKDANLRKSWDEIAPGAPRKTLPYVLTREAIKLYCNSVGEDHPIYFDDAYARTTRYSGLLRPRLDHPADVTGGFSWQPPSKTCRPAIPSMALNSRSAANRSGCSAMPRSITIRCISTTIT